MVLYLHRCQWNVLDPPAAATACPWHSYHKQYQPVQHAHRSCAMQPDKAIEVHADTPGVKKGDIQLDIDNNILSLTVSFKDENDIEKEVNEVKWKMLTSSTVMERLVRLPETSDMANVSAAHQNKVLNVTVPKKEVPRPTGSQLRKGHLASDPGMQLPGDWSGGCSDMGSSPRVCCQSVACLGEANACSRVRAASDVFG
jgi:HSP20 family molecular chaperone IbpA